MVKIFPVQARAFCAQWVVRPCKPQVLIKCTHMTDYQIHSTKMKTQVILCLLMRTVDIWHGALPASKQIVIRHCCRFCTVYYTLHSKHFYLKYYPSAYFRFLSKKLLVMYMYKTRKRSIDNNNKNIFILNHVVMMKKGIKREKKVR